MSNLAETYEGKGAVVKLYYEEDSSYDPRDNDNLGTMYCWHPDHTLGDEQFTRDDHPDCETLQEVALELQRTRGAICILPLVILEHGGVTMRVGTSFAEDSGGWDTTRVGFIYTTWDRVRELGAPGNPEEIEEQLSAEVREYASWLEGDVYYYVAEDEDGETLDSCGGYIGHEYAEEAAKEALDYAVANVERESQERNYWNERGVMTA